MLIGWAISILGSILVLIAAFKKSVWWGLGSLFVPFVVLIFVILNWAAAKRGFLLSLAGLALAIVGITIVMVSGGHSATQ